MPFQDLGGRTVLQFLHILKDLSSHRVHFLQVCATVLHACRTMPLLPPANTRMLHCRAITRALLRPMPLLLPASSRMLHCNERDVTIATIAHTNR